MCACAHARVLGFVRVHYRTRGLAPMEGVLERAWNHPPLERRLELVTKGTDIAGFRFICAQLRPFQASSVEFSQIGKRKCVWVTDRGFAQFCAMYPATGQIDLKQSGPSALKCWDKGRLSSVRWSISPDWGRNTDDI